MKRAVLFSFVILSLAACSKHDDGPSKSKSLDRKSLHKAKECPSGLEGEYVEQGDPSTNFKIVKQGDVYIIQTPKSGDFRIDGSVAVDKQDGSAQSYICSGSAVDAVVVTKDGQTLKGKFEVKGPRTLIAKVSSAGGTSEYIYDKISGADLVTPSNAADNQAQDLSSSDDTFEIPDMPSMPPMPKTPRVERPETSACGNSSFFTSYTYNVNGCSTGEQVFCSLRAYCDGLQSESLNKSCAREQRMQAYAQSCK